MDEATAIQTIADGAVQLVAALGFIPATLAAPLVLLAGGIGALFGARKERKRQKKQLDQVAILDQGESNE